MSHPLSPKLRATLQREVNEAFGGPSLGFSLDIRKLAGFAPALIVDLKIPPGEPELRILGPFRMATNGHTQVVAPRRSEFWVLDSGPRSAQAVSILQVFASRSDVADTLYKLYFQLPAHGNWEVEVPSIESATYQFEAEHIKGNSEDGRAYMRAGSEA